MEQWLTLKSVIHFSVKDQMTYEEYEDNSRGPVSIMKQATHLSCVMFPINGGTKSMLLLWRSSVARRFNFKRPSTYSKFI